MKILYVISTPIEYSSSANMRNIALISGLIENGHKVDLISDGYNTESKYIDHNICKIKFNKRYYLRKITTSHNNTNHNSKIKEKVAKLISKISIYDNRKILVNNAKKIRLNENYDIMISSSDPKSSHLIAKEILRNNRISIKKWVQYWGDPFANDINKKTIIPTKYIKREERKILSLADKIVYVSPFTLKKQRDIYPKESSRMCFFPIPYLKEKIYQKNITNQVTLGYFGDYSSKDRNIIPLYKSIEKTPNIKLIIYGNSNINLKETNNIIIKDRQSTKNVEQAQEKCTILVCICNKEGTQIPGKIYHYSATNKPILIILDGENSEEIKDYLKKFDRYEFCVNDEESIKSAIERISRSKFNPCPAKKLSCKKIAIDFINEMKW